ncbi:MAG: RNA polymerase sigma factor [Sedimentisphaerales bacterium]|nr:RNA polymerase sigma factor [Sedimentisphaerales bacterium]MBN2844115.1 RNA polymerase sigma factor [Sedimentisphaerales bacterium]
MRKGEQAEILEKFYQLHGQAVMRFLARRVTYHQACDLFQDVFLAAANNTEKLIAARSPGAWLLAIAHNLLCNYFRDKRNVVSLTESIPAKEPDTNIFITSVAEAIKLLPQNSQEIMLLRWYDQLTYEEIALVLNIPIGTVRSRLHNAIVKLRKIMAQEQGEIHL